MKIGIDISQIVYGTGVSVYTRNLIDTLFEIDKKNEYLLFGGSLRRLEELKKFHTSTLVHWCKAKKSFWPIPPTVVDILWNQLHVLPVEKLIGSVDVFHSSDWTQPPTRAAKVTTIHDLSFLRWPDSVHPKVLATQKRRLEWVKREIDLIIAVSEATKKETIELLGIPEEKIVVVYEGPPSDVIGFRPVGLDSIKKKLGINKPYLFTYGSQAPRKNVTRLIEAFKQVENEVSCQLVITGEYQSKQKLPTGVVMAGFLPRQQWLTLLTGAEALVYPSLYEGFGLPILSAFVLDVPVVTSNISSMPEVAGKAAVLVNPHDVKNIAEGIKKAVKNKQKLIAAGRKQVQKFSWEKAARETIGVYEKAFRFRSG